MIAVKPCGDVVPFARPSDWDDRNGICRDLPVRREVEGLAGKAYLQLVSNWKPNSDELAQLNAGYVVELTCCGFQPAVSMTVVPCADPDPEVRAPSRCMEAIRGAVARGWCDDANAHKEMDVYLGEAISREVARLFGIDAPTDPLFGADVPVSPPTLQQSIASAISAVRRENVSNTPDSILAKYMESCLAAFEVASKEREAWYGVVLAPCPTTPQWDHRKYETSPLG